MKRLIKCILAIICIAIFCMIVYDLKEPIMKKIYVIEYSDSVEKYSTEYNVDKHLIYAIIKAESNFEKDAVSSKGAKGLMQLMNSTAEDIAKELDINLDEDDILDPDINIMLGTKYISDLIEKYNSIELALTAYNAGGGKVDSWISDNTLKEDGSNIENIPYTETNKNDKKILRDYKIYKELY